MTPTPSITVADTEVAAGTTERIDLPVARFPSGAWQGLSITVMHGRKPGPVMALTAAVHGDELNGIATIHQVLDKLRPRDLAGTVIAVPVVNVFGLSNQTRYLPDRRDLNRSFPGSTRGSLAAQIAHVILNEIIAPADVVIDLHTGAVHRANLPQIRANLEDESTLACAQAFAAPLTLHASTRDHSLRQSATRLGKTVLLYEGGEGLRLSTAAISAATDGTLRVLAHLGMIAEPSEKRPGTTIAKSSHWIRASRSGLLQLDVDLGDEVVARKAVGTITDPLRGGSKPVKAHTGGMVLGINYNPLVYRGDALLHLAEV